MWSRIELKARAKELLRLNYWKVVLASLILFLTGDSGGANVRFSYSSGSSTGSSGVLSSIGYSGKSLSAYLIALSFYLILAGIIIIIVLALSLFIFNPLRVGCQRYFLLCGRYPASFKEVGFAFSHSYLNIVKVMFFKDLYTFLWSLLFIVPGIIKSYEYRMIPYLLAENPDLDMNAAFTLTKRMMYGDKLNAWVLDLSFIGWNLLGALTCCILNIFYVSPYQNLTNAQLFEALKGKLSGPYGPGCGTQNPYEEREAGPSPYGSERNPYL